MRHRTLIPAALAALLVGLVAAPAHAQDERALARAAFERARPMMGEMAKKAFAEGIANADTSDFGGCVEAERQMRTDLERDATPLVMELFFSAEMRDRMEQILVDVFDAEQLKIAADGGDPPSTPEQSRKMSESFGKLSADFQQRLAQDPRVMKVIAESALRSQALLKQCQARDEG